MAWERFDRDGVGGATGDTPLDELGFALKAIARAYQDQFGRKPSVLEVIYNLERLLRSAPERYVSDPEGLIDLTLRIDRKEGTVKQHADPERYEAVYSEQPAPGEYQVVTRGPNGQATTHVVISIPRLELEKETLFIDYQVRDDGLADDDAALLIREKLLGELLFDRYAEDARELELRDLKSGKSRRMPYADL